MNMFPIVLVHGIARFDILAEILRRLRLDENAAIGQFQYFNNIASHLVQNGFQDVFAPNLDFAGPSELRASQLKTAIDFYLEQSNSTKVHIIAHSMGGLDSRRMILDRGMASKVASLTTIGTPHLGSPLADFLIANDGLDLLHAIQRFLRLDFNGLNDLTKVACQEFNSRALDEEARNEVEYQTYASHEREDRIFGPLLPTYEFLKNIEGANDGLVPLVSQKWTEHLIATDGTRKKIVQKEFAFPADHLNQTGWWDWEERNGAFELANPLTQKREYEEKVKGIYLDIAQSVEHL